MIQVYFHNLSFLFNKDENTQDTVEDKNKFFDDLYKLENEIKYNNLKKYKSAGVMENEKIIIEEIINYKKSKNLDYDYFENNSNLIDMAISKIQTDIICNVLTIDGYKIQVKNQLEFELDNIEKAKIDIKVSDEERKIIINRIEKRIEILNIELIQEVEGYEENEDENNENLNKELKQENKEKNEKSIIQRFLKFK